MSAVLEICSLCHRNNGSILFHRSKRFCSSSPISNQILWRSITRDSTAKVPSISFNEVFERTKVLRDNNREWEQTEKSLITAAESQRSQSPLRVARLITHLHNLPYGLSHTKSICDLINIYVECYETLCETNPIQHLGDCEELYRLQRQFLVRQLLAIPKLCHGILEKSTESNNLFSIENSGQHLTEFINKFASQRLATRVMSAHNLTLYDQIKRNSEIKMGLFEENCDVLKSIKQAIADSEQDCYRCFGEICADIKVNCSDMRRNEFESNDFTYIPQHLHIMIFELLKNSMRAIVENGAKQREIEIVIVAGNDASITLKISDIGGGIARHDLSKIWLYGYTTAFDDIREKLIKHKELLSETIDFAEKQWQSETDIYDTHLSLMGGVKYTPMFGLGYGLPVTQLYATFFGGNCKIQSIHGHGSDAYLYLQNLSNCRNIIM